MRAAPERVISGASGNTNASNSSVKPESFPVPRPADLRDLPVGELDVRNPHLRSHRPLEIQ